MSYPGLRMLINGKHGPLWILFPSLTNWTVGGIVSSSELQNSNLLLHKVHQRVDCDLAVMAKHSRNSVNPLIAQPELRGIGLAHVRAKVRHLLPVGIKLQQHCIHQSVKYGFRAGIFTE